MLAGPLHETYSPQSEGLSCKSALHWAVRKDLKTPTTLIKQSLDGCIRVAGCLCITYLHTTSWSQSKSLTMFAFAFAPETH